MSLTVNLKSYVNDTQRSPDSFRYTGPANTLSAKDYIDLKRTAPKVTATSAGKARSQVKLTRTLTDGTAAVGDAIYEFNFSVPVGAQSSEITAMLTDIATWAATAACADLVEDLDIVQ